VEAWYQPLRSRDKASGSANYYVYESGATVLTYLCLGRDNERSESDILTFGRHWRHPWSSCINCEKYQHLECRGGSFSTCRISELVPDPNTRASLTHRSFVSDVLPPILCYFAIALLSLLPDTFPLRVGLLPMALYSAFRAVTTIDVALSTEHSGLNYLNQAFSVSPFLLASFC
jgi:hypothetical protein